MAAEQWSRIWQRALYDHPAAGFYLRHAPIAHFCTASAGIPGTNDILADAVARLARSHGHHHIVDVAAGRGELAAALARRHHDLSVTAIDVVARPAQLPVEVHWERTPGGAASAVEHAELRNSLIVAWEWLDVVPLDILECDEFGQWREVLTDETGSESLGAPESEPDGQWRRRWWPGPATPGHRVEVGRARDEAWARVARNTQGCTLLAVDYGHTRDSRPTAGTLIGHLDGHPVPPIPDGSRDLTAHVAVDSLAAAVDGTVTTQREALRGLGVTAALPDLNLATTDPAAYGQELQRAGAAARLLDPAGLGGFSWVLSRT